VGVLVLALRKGNLIEGNKANVKGIVRGQEEAAKANDS
jgi:hypothetical protein